MKKKILYGIKFCNGKLFAFLAAAILVLAVNNTNAQNAIVGTGFSTGWGGVSCPTGNTNFKFMSAGAGTSYGVTTVANGTGNQYFRFGVDWSGTTGQYTITPGSDVTVSPNTTYSLNTGCTTSGSMLINVPSVSYNYVFKTLNAGTAPTGTFVFFEVQGTPITVSSVTRNTPAKDVPTLVTATLSAALPAGQAVYLRYTNAGYSPSTVVQMTGSGTSYTASIPASINTAAANVSYYVFTSGTSNVASDGSNADLYTINLNNNGGSNYSYTVPTTYYSKGNLAFNTASNWNTLRDGTGTNASNFTTSGTVFVVQGTGGGLSAPHTMTSGSTVTIGAGVTVVVESGGTLEQNSTITFNGTANFQLNAGGIFKQSATNASGISAGIEIWDPAATVLYANTGYISTANITGGAHPNVTVSTGGNANFGGAITNIAGNLTMAQSGTSLTLTGATAMTLTIGGNLILQSGTTFSIGNGSATPIVNLAGNLSIASGMTFTYNGSGAQGTLNFTKAGTQTLTNSGTMSGAVNYNVNNGATLDLGTSIVAGTGTFTIASGGGLITANTNATGALTTSGSNGSIQVTGTRTFNTAANYTFNGASAQVAGNGFTGANNLTLNNSGGLTLSAAVPVTGTLTLISGKLTLGANNLTLTGATVSGASSSNYILTNSTGSVLRSITSGGGSFAFPIGRSSSAYNPLTITNTGGTTAVYTVSTAATTYSPTADGANAQWSIAAGASTTSTLAFEWLTADAGANLAASPSSGLAYQYNGATWDNRSGTTTGTPNVTTVTGITNLTNPIWTVAKPAATPAVSLNEISTVGAANIAQGTNSNVIYNFSLAVTTANTQLTQLTIPTTGTYTSSDVTLKLWYNSTNNGPGAGATVISTIAPAGAGTETFGSLTQSITAGNTGYFWVTADVAGGATIGRTITVTPALASGNFTFSPAVSFSVGTINAGGTQTVSAGTSNINLSEISTVGAASIAANATNNIIYNFKLAVTSVATTLTQVDIPNSGTYTSGDLSNLKLWYNSTNNGPGAGATVISTITSPGNTSPQSFASLSQAIGIGATGFFWVTADVSASPGNGNTITVTPALAFSNLSFSGSINPTTGTINAGGTQTLTSTPDVALSEISTVGTANIAQATTNNIIYNFKLDVTTAPTTLTQVTIPNSGTYSGTDFTNLKLWYNSSNNGPGAGATAIKTISSPSNTSPQTFASLSQTISTGATGYFWVTADVAGGGTVGNTITVTPALASGNFTFTASVNFTTGTINAGGTQTISAGTSGVTLSEISTVGAGNISIGSTANVLYNFKLDVASVAATLTQVTIPNTGSYTGTDFANLKLVYKATNDGPAGGTTLATITTPSNTSPQTFGSFSQPIGIGATGYFWVTADVDAGATPGNTITVTPALDFTNLTFSGSISSTVGTINAGGTKTIVLTSNATDAYQTAASGDWNSNSTWQSFTGGNWIPATQQPGTSAASITILNTHTVTIPNTVSVTADDITVNSGGQITVASGGTLVVADGAAATDITVNGVLKNSGTLTLTGAATVSGAAAIYEHNLNNLTIPAFTWASGSTLKLTGTFTGTGTGANLAQLSAGAYQNILWQGAVSFSGGSTVDFVSFGDNAITVAGKLTAAGSGNGALLTSASGTSPTVAEYEQTSGIVYVNRNSGSTRSLTVTGNATISGGALHIKVLAGSGLGQFTVGGNLDIQSSGTLTNSGTAGSALVQFNGTAAQQFSVTGTFSGTVGLELNNTNGLTINNAISVGGTTTKLTAGTITHGGNLTILTGATITRVAGNFATAPTFAGTVSVTYANTAATLNTDVELPSMSVTTLSTAGGSQGVFLTSNTSVGTLTVSGGNFTVNATKTLTIGTAATIGSGKTLQIDGTVINSTATAWTQTGATITVNGLYQHNVNSGTIPTATWNTGSTCEVLGTTSAAPAAASLGQLFHNFTWNCVGMTSASINLQDALGLLSGGTRSISGNFTIANTSPTAGRVLRLYAGTTNASFSVGGDFIINNANARFEFSNGNATNSVLTIGGNFNMSNGSFAANTSGNLSVIFTGVSKTFTQGGGTLDNALVNWKINSSASFSLGSNFPTASSRTLTIDGTIDCGATYGLTGSGTVSVSNGGLLKVGAINVAGAFATNVTATTVTLNSGSTVEFNGAGAQYAAARTFSNLRINNGANGVTLLGDVTANGTLTLTSGNITTGSNKVILASGGSITGASSSSYIAGNLQRGIPTGAASYSFPIGDATNYTPATISFASVTTGGNLTANTTGSEHPNIGTSYLDNTKSVNRYWTLTNSGIVFTNYDATFNFVAGDIDGGSSTSAFSIGKYSSGTWSYPTTGTLTGTSSQITGVTSFSDFAIAERHTNDWTGASNTVWNNAANWGGGVPASGKNIVIPNGLTNYPVLDISPTVTNVTLGSGATVSINGQTLTINGAVSGSGTVSGSASSNLIINGTAGTIQFTSGGTNNYLKDLTIGASGSMTIGSNELNIAAGASAGTVSIANGGVLTTGGYLNLKSDANGTARIAANGSGSTYISGDVTVERYIPANANRAWRLLGVPTKGTQTIKEAWQENQPAGDLSLSGKGTQITSNSASWAANGFDFLTGGNSILSYDASIDSWMGNYGKSTATSNTIENTEAYMLFVRGDRTIAPGPGSITPTTLRSKGTLYQGTQSGIAVGASQYLPIGNLYASSIDFRLLSKTGDIDSVFYVWDPKLTGAYGLGGYQTLTYSGGNFLINPGGGSFGAMASTMDTIQSGQGFFVHSSGSGGTIVFNESAKVTGSRSGPFTPVTIGERFATRMFAINGGNNDLADGTLTLYDAANSNAVNGSDAKKIANFGENLGMMRDGKLLATEQRELIGITDTIYLNGTGFKQQNYQFEFTAENLNHPNLLGKLVDNYLSTNTPIDLNGTTLYNFTVNADPASSAAGRFKVIFYPSGPLPVTITSVKAYQQGANIAVEWKVENQVNMAKYEIEKSTDGRNFSKAGAQNAVGANGASVTYNWLDIMPVSGDNFYRIKSIGLAGDVKYSSIVKVKMGKGEPAITVYPNPVVNHTVSVEFANMDKGLYTVRLVNAIGQVLMSKQINHAGGNATQTMVLDNAVTKGSYQLEVIKTDGSKQVIKLVVAE